MGDESETDSAASENRIRGVVTRVVRDRVMASVEIQAGHHRIVSITGLEDAQGLEPGMVAVASVQFTDVVVEIPAGR